MKLVLVIDAKTTEHVVDKQGIGRMTHTEVAHLWLQDESRSNRFLKCVESRANTLWLTWSPRPLSRALIVRHAEPSETSTCRTVSGSAEEAGSQTAAVAARE